MDFVWATRRHQSARHLSVPQAVAFAQQQQQSAGAGLPPIVMAEVWRHSKVDIQTYLYIHTYIHIKVTDNPGSGKSLLVSVAAAVQCE